MFDLVFESTNSNRYRNKFKKGLRIRHRRRLQLYYVILYLLG